MDYLGVVLKLVIGHDLQRGLLVLALATTLDLLLFLVLVLHLGLLLLHLTKQARAQGLGKVALFLVVVLLGTLMGSTSRTIAVAIAHGKRLGLLNLLAKRAMAKWTWE